jgi:hypothetical protein
VVCVNTMNSTIDLVELFLFIAHALTKYDCRELPHDTLDILVLYISPVSCEI